jgi:molybdenum cofactor cytidylyltransferase
VNAGAASAPDGAPGRDACAAHGPLLVVLAAGASVRLGEPKALVAIGGRSVVAALVEEAESVFERALVVVGAHADAIRAHLDAHFSTRPAARARIDVVVNAEHERGRTGSLGVAVRAAQGRDLVVAPVDVPRVEQRTFEQLAAAWREAGAPPRGWLAPWVPRHDGTRGFGHPIAIGRELARAVLGMEPDAPLHRLRAQAAPLLSVEVASARILEDLDTPADLGELRRRAAAGD